MYLWHVLRSSVEDKQSDPSDLRFHCPEFQALVIAPPIVQYANSTCLEDAELSHLLSDLASADPVFQDSLRTNAETPNRRVGVLATTDMQPMQVQSMLEAAAEVLRVHVIPNVLGRCHLYSRWQKGVQKLQAFKNSHGHTRVPQMYVTSDGIRLGWWVSTQRVKKSKQKLTKEQVEQLEELGFVWSVLDEQRELMLRRLATYKSEHGDVNVPQMYVTSDGIRLGWWVSTQRVKKSKQKLTKEQVEQLEELGFVWSVLDEQRELMLRRLATYKSEHGDVNVPWGYVTSDGVRLGLWVGTQRVKKSKQKLTKEQVEQLEELGFVWSVLDEQRELMLRRLATYKSEHGDVNVPQGYVTSDGVRLGLWVRTQRVNKSKQKLTKEQVEQLEELGFVWSVLDEQRELMLRRLATYKSEHGDVNVPWGYVTSDGVRLGQWVSNQRGNKSKQKLTKEQVEQLEELGFVWNVLDEQRELMLRRLATYKSEHGDVNVPQGYVTSDGVRLGLWVRTQRVNKSKQKLTKEQVEQLEELGFVWSVLDEQRELMLRRLATYKSEHGDVNVPKGYVTSDGVRLGKWVSTQRVNKSKQILTKEQVEQLGELGFVWSVLDEQRELMLRRLATYKSEHGDVNVPQGYVTSDGVRLGLWVGTQRVKKSKQKLNIEQVEQLEELGFVWSVLDEQRELMLRRLATYKSEHGDVNVTKGYVTSDGVRLGKWVSNQRVNKSKQKLTKEQVEQLEELGFVWSVLDEQRELMLRRLATYKSEHGDVNVQREYVTSDGVRLGKWVNRQRVKKSKQKLTKE